MSNSSKFIVVSGANFKNFRGLLPALMGTAVAASEALSAFTAASGSLSAFTTASKEHKNKNPQPYYRRFEKRARK